MFKRQSNIQKEGPTDRLRELANTPVQVVRPTRWQRKRLKVVFKSDSGYSPTKELKKCDYDDLEANLIISEVDENWHAPVLDLDFHCDLLPSATEGHYHLYLDKLIPWTDYVKLMNVMQEIGLVEKGWVESALANKYSGVRSPGILKYEIVACQSNLNGIIESLANHVDD